MKRLNQILALGSALALVAAAGCKKDDKGDGKAPEAGKTTPDKTPDSPPDTPETKPAEPVEMQLPKTGLAITVPPGTTVEEAIIAGADQVNFPGVTSAMVVRPRLVTDSEMGPWMEKAKSHGIMKFKREIVKEGEGKTYTYMHEVELNGQPKVVYMQMFQLGDKDYACFSNADNEDAAKAMQAACATVKVGEGGAAAADGDDDDDDDGDDDDADEGATKTAPKKAPAKKSKKDEGGW